MWHFLSVCMNVCLCLCVCQCAPITGNKQNDNFVVVVTAAAASLLHLHFDFLALSLQFRNSFCCRLRAHILTLLSEHDSLMRARSLPESCLQAASMSSKLLAARCSLPCLSSCLAWCCSQAQRQMKSQQQCSDKDLAASGSSDTHTYNRAVPAAASHKYRQWTTPTSTMATAPSAQRPASCTALRKWTQTSSWCASQRRQAQGGGEKEVGSVGKGEPCRGKQDRKIILLPTSLAAQLNLPKGPLPRRQQVQRLLLAIFISSAAGKKKKKEKKRMQNVRGHLSWQLKSLDYFVTI